MHTVHIVHNCALHSAVQRCLHWAPRLAIAGHADSPGIVHINHLQTCFCTTTPFELTDHTNAAFFPFLHFAQNLTSSLSIPIPKFNLNQTPDAFKPQFSRQFPEAISGRKCNKLNPTFQSKHLCAPLARVSQF